MSSKAVKGQLNLFPERFIKDADCTKDTPVTLGKQDAPVYGQGIRIKPREPGRTDSEHFKKDIFRKPFTTGRVRSHCRVVIRWQG